MPKQSLATYSLLNQKAEQEESKNDAVIPGTFGGDNLGGLNNVPYENRNSLTGSASGNYSYAQNSTHQKSIVADSEGIASFNPSNM